MLYAYINGDGKQVISREVRRCVQPDVFEHPVIREALEKIEGVYKIEGLALYTKEHGVLSPDSISNGLKALLLCYYQDKGICKTLISSGCFGDNVGEYVQRLSLEINIHIAWMSYLPMDWDAPILATNVATGEVITDVDTFQREIGRKGGEPSVPATECPGF